MIYALGAQGSLVGVDLSSTFPPEIKKLPNIGYHRALSAEGILSLNPTLIIHDNNIGPANVVTQLQQLNIPMKTFSAKNDSIEGTKTLLREMGSFFHKEQRAEELCRKLDTGMHEAAELVKHYKDHPRVAVIHFGRASNVYLLVGNGGGGDAGSAGKMVEWAGGQLAIQKPGMQRMVSPELIAQSNPDVILMTEFGFDRLGSADQAKTLAGVAETEAAKHNRIYRVPEHDLMYFGPDTGAKHYQADAPDPRIMKRRNRDRMTLAVLLAVTVFTTAASIRFGAIDFSAHDMVTAVSRTLSGSGDLTLNQWIFMQLRVPRAILSLLVGACLGVGGTLIQGLFRNPIVEPGLVGTSSGAAFGAALFYVFGALLKVSLGEWTLPFAACAGGVLSTYLVFALAQTRNEGRSSIMLLLLSGLAINALFMSGIGFLSYVARDPQARSIIYWNLGTISGANWNSVVVVGFATAVGTAAAVFCAKPLNTLMLGEDEAAALGVNVGRLKWVVLV